MQDRNRATVVVSDMELRNLADQNWKTAAVHTKGNKKEKRLLRYVAIFAVISLFAGTGGALILRHPESSKTVMGHLRADFEYDEMLGRLQFVNHLLPESAMVFLEKVEDTVPVSGFPSGAKLVHEWSHDEPWFEYGCTGEITACLDGQVTTIVKNRDDEYTVRIGHQNGYESLYSGLKDVQVKEYDTVCLGQKIGISAGYTAYEWRKDGLSILPAQFSFEGADREI